MTAVYFISDLHLGHKNVLKYADGYRQGSTVDEHDEWLLGQIASVMRKRDILWVLGDVAHDFEKLKELKKIPGQKILVRGNHDTFKTSDYLDVFSEVYGIYKKYGMWISHCPIHPHELRGKPNIHGHVHTQTILQQEGKHLEEFLGVEGVADERYINVSVEALYGVPISLESLRQGRYWERQKLLRPYRNPEGVYVKHITYPANYC